MSPGDPCPSGRECSEAEGRCITLCHVASNWDGDAYDSIDCGGTDCDDGDPSVFPGAPEVCNGRDDDCDERVDEGGVADGCPAPSHSTPVCRASAPWCGFVCDAGFGDCDGSASNGCETSTVTTLAHCGACGAACPARDNAIVGCSEGACTYECVSPFANCDGSIGNGCETDPQRAPDHCGGCGRACPSRANASRTCAAGSCGFACDAGFRDCDGGTENGCEVRVTIDLSHCGACGTVCPTRANASRTCVDGSCGFTCGAGFLDCDGAATNGCEIDVTRDLSHCGTCGTVCPTRPNATRTCTAGTCGFTCNGTYRDCDGAATNGCETNVATAPTHCGACGDACPARANATPTCTSGSCRLACDAGYDDCDGFDDVIVGSPGGGAPGGGGAAYVYCGGPSMSTSPCGILVGAAGSVFGISVSGAGDMDANGMPDVIVGGHGGAGTASIYLGAAGSVVTSAARTWTGPSTGAAFGISVAGAGDTNGDGLMDVIVGVDPGSAGLVAPLPFVGPKRTVQYTRMRLFRRLSAGVRPQASVEERTRRT